MKRSEPAIMEATTHRYPSALSSASCSGVSWGLRPMFLPGTFSLLFAAIQALRSRRERLFCPR